MIKESEKQEIDFNSNWGVKKIYVTQEELDAVNKHIDDVINGN